MLRATAILIAGLAVWLLLRRSSAAGRCTWLGLVSLGLVVLPWLVFFGPSIPVTLPWLTEPAPIVLDASVDQMGGLDPAPAPREEPFLALWLAVALAALLPAVAGSVVMNRRWQRLELERLFLERGKASPVRVVGVVNRVGAPAPAESSTAVPPK
jgi:hypothetical protein